jgi:metal-responsive CopG/Arc/MetJ family transcriptional regulator
MNFNTPTGESNMKKRTNKDRRIKLGIAMPPTLVKQLDAQAKREERSRSNMIVQFVRRGLE